MICELKDEGEWEHPEFEQNVFELFEDDEDEQKLFCFYCMEDETHFIAFKEHEIILIEKYKYFYFLNLQTPSQVHCVVCIKRYEVYNPFSN